MGAASTPRQGPGRDASRDQPVGTTALIGQLISTIFFNIDILGRMQLPFLADPGTGRSWYDRADPEEWHVSSPDATMTAAGAAESVGGGEAVGMPSLRQAASGLAAALSQGTTVAREAAGWARNSPVSPGGDPSVAPARGDRRFADPAWTSNMAFRMIQQSYLASAQALDRIVAGMPDGRSGILAEQAQFAASIVTSAAAPTNFLLSNPAALKRAFDTGGMSLAAGRPQLRPRRAPQRRRCRRWSNPARSRWAGIWPCHPGAVVAPRRGRASSSSTSPTTEQVFQRPVLVVPPPIGRFYFLDLRPGPQLRRVRRQPRAADVHAQLAQPDRRAGSTGTSTPTLRRCRRHRRGPRDHRQRRTST